MSLLTVEHLKKVYTTRFGGNKVEALRDVNFSVEEGEYVAIMGESGSGKTTLLNILASLDKPTSGSVVLEDKELSKIKEGNLAAFRRDNLGFVFQDFNLLDTFSLEDNIYLPLVLAQKNHREMEERLRPIAEKLGITQLLKKYPYEVSGGQKQRAAVARAVIMVIIATYLLFIAGSVVFCRILQKNKKYYYKKQHFVSVSSMVFRMKRNGAGLASICVLSTMVLVMLSSTSSLYFGMEDTINRRYPRECAFSVEAPELEGLSEENLSVVRGAFEEIASDHGLQMRGVLEYSHAEITGLFTEDEVNLDSQSVDSNDMSVAEKLRQIVFVRAEDYNRITGSDIHPVEGEAYCLPVHCTYEKNRIIMGELDLQVKGILTGEFPINGNISASVVPYILFVVPDLSAVRPLMSLKDYRGEQMLSVRWDYEYDLPGAKEEEIIEVFQAHRSKIIDMDFFKKGNGGFSYSLSCKALEKADFLNTFGGMFFLGIILSLVFISAAVLIIYYKQISEGYEDQARFEIMQKVGMTRGDIKKSINSQVLTVFFAPLLLAGIHLAFAYPMIWKILQLFFMRNLAFVVLVTIGDFVWHFLCHRV